MRDDAESGLRLCERRVWDCGGGGGGRRKGRGIAADCCIAGRISAIKGVSPHPKLELWYPLGNFASIHARAHTDIGTSTREVSAARWRKLV